MSNRRPARNTTIRKFFFESNFNYTTDNDNHLESREAVGAFRIELQNSDALHVEYFRDYEFLKRPFQIASIVPSSKALVERVASKMDFTKPRVIAEYGPGEGVHSREIARRMTPDSELLLFELDAALARALERQFAGDPRVHVINGDAATLPDELLRRGLHKCDYILSGIPFSILEKNKKRRLPAFPRPCLLPIPCRFGPAAGQFPRHCCPQFRMLKPC